MSKPPPTIPAELTDRYRPVRELGRGAFGVVIEAVRLEDAQGVAIKVLTEGAGAGPEVRERFARECRAGAKLEHPHVVAVLEFGGESEPWLVQELVPGGSLEERLAQPISVEQADAILDGILDGLEAAHRVGLTHRDLKPANVLLDHEGRPKLADFGLAHGGFEATLTRTGTILGTPLYMTLGQMTGEAPRPGWDVYAAAVIYFEMLVGRPPFRAGDIGELLEEKQRGIVAGPAAEGVPVPPSLDKLLRVALGPTGPQEYPDVASFREALASIRELAALGLDTPTAPSHKTSVQGAPALEPPRDPPPRAARGAPAGTEPPAAPAASTAPLEASAVPTQLGASRAAGARRVGGLLAVVFALGFGWGLGQTPPEELPPTPEPSLEPVPTMGWETRLQDLRGALVDDEQVLRILAATGTDQTEEDRAALDDVVAAVEQRLGELDILALRRAVEAGELGVPALHALGRVVGIVQLVGRAKVGRVIGDTRGPRARALLDAYGAFAHVRRIHRDLFPHTRKTLPEGGRLHRARVAGEEATWRLLRAYPDLPRDPNDHGVPTPNHRIIRFGYFGTPFVDPVGEAAAVLASSLGAERDTALIEAAHPEISLDLAEEPAGELDLMIIAEGWNPTIQGVVELESPEGPVEVPLQLPPGIPEVAPRNQLRGGAVKHWIHIGEPLVPEGTHRLRIRFRGVQPYTDGECVVYTPVLWQKLSDHSTPG